MIAVTTPKRLPQFPEVPTVSESGLSGFEFNSWYAMMAPAGTPKAVVTRINALVNQALEAQERLAQRGLQVGLEAGLLQ